MVFGESPSASLCQHPHVRAQNRRRPWRGGFSRAARARPELPRADVCQLTRERSVRAHLSRPLLGLLVVFVGLLRARAPDARAWLWGGRAQHTADATADAADSRAVLARIGRSAHKPAPATPLLQQLVAHAKAPAQARVAKLERAWARAKSPARKESEKVRRRASASLGY